MLVRTPSEEVSGHAGSCNSSDHFFVTRSFTTVNLCLFVYLFLGNGLNIGSCVKPSLPPHITCPRVLEFRQLIQYKPLTMNQRQQITKAMQAYGEYMEKRQTGLDDLLPRDPRDESEKIAAEELEDKVR